MSVSFFPLGHDTLDDPNFHNVSAVALLGLLGYEVDVEDLTGMEQDPGLFLGRALIASALVDVATADAVGLPCVQDGRFVQGGRSPGRVADQLTELIEMALKAQKLKVPIVWS